MASGSTRFKLVTTPRSSKLTGVVRSWNRYRSPLQRPAPAWKLLPASAVLWEAGRTPWKTAMGEACESADFNRDPKGNEPAAGAHCRHEPSKRFSHAYRNTRGNSMLVSRDSVLHRPPRRTLLLSTYMVRQQRLVESRLGYPPAGDHEHLVPGPWNFCALAPRRTC